MSYAALPTAKQLFAAWAANYTLTNSLFIVFGNILLTASSKVDLTPFATLPRSVERIQHIVS